MARTSNPLSNGEAEHEARRIRQDITETRAEMTGTIEELHGKLNPKVLKEQAIEQFHDAAALVRAEMADLNRSLKAEIREELAEAKAALRNATIGKVETLIESTRHDVRAGAQSVVTVTKQHPVAFALLGLGVGWLFLRSRTQNIEQALRGNPWLAAAAVCAASTVVGLAIPGLRLRESSPRPSHSLCD